MRKCQTATICSGQGWATDWYWIVDFVPLFASLKCDKPDRLAVRVCAGCKEIIWQRYEKHRRAGDYG